MTSATASTLSCVHLSFFLQVSSSAEFSRASSSSSSSSTFNFRRPLIVPIDLYIHGKCFESCSLSQTPLSRAEWHKVQQPIILQIKLCVREFLPRMIASMQHSTLTDQQKLAKMKPKIISNEQFVFSYVFRETAPNYFVLRSKANGVSEKRTEDKKADSDNLHEFEYAGGAYELFDTSLHSLELRVIPNETSSALSVTSSATGTDAVKEKDSAQITLEQSLEEQKEQAKKRKISSTHAQDKRRKGGEVDKQDEKKDFAEDYNDSMEIAAAPSSTTSLATSSESSSAPSFSSFSSNYSPAASSFSSTTAPLSSVPSASLASAALPSSSASSSFSSSSSSSSVGSFPATISKSWKMLGIVGASGGGDGAATMSVDLYRVALLEIRRFLSNHPQINQLISGGSSFIDHIAVSIFLEDFSTNSRKRLTLCLPCSWDSSYQRFFDSGAFDFRINPGGTLNGLHNKFSKTSLKELDEAIRKGADVEVRKGMHARNTAIAKMCDVLLALTLSESESEDDAPAHGGTKHTWDQAKKFGKPCFHISLTKLMKSSINNSSTPA